MPKIVDHDAYRQELISGAIRLFSERGYGQVTMRQVARALNVSTGTFYHYFTSKQTLFEAVVQSVVANNINEALRAIPKSDTVTVRMILTHLLDGEAHHMRQFLVLIDYLRIHPERRPLLEPLMMEAHHNYARLTASMLGLDDPEQGAFVLSALFTILESRWIHGARYIHEPQVLLLERFVRMCQTPQETP